jgi:murein DD-endopeptidase MepM/ murein hydrolase activator NlpD
MRTGLLISVAAALLLHPGATAARAAAYRPYGWPVAPFDRQHPIRGGFGDPRTVFDGPPTAQGLLADAGSFRFHFGVDIAAANGTKVHPVVAGAVSKLGSDRVVVDCGDGRIFQYVHIRPAVKHASASRSTEPSSGRSSRPRTTCT